MARSRLEAIGSTGLTLVGQEQEAALLLSAGRRSGRFAGGAAER
jgi:hypothetical protein